MSRRTYWARTIISVAMIATGIYFLIAGHVRANSDCVALGAEPGRPQGAERAEAMPTFENAKTELRALSGSLSEEISRWAKASADPHWLGYSVPAVGGGPVICCNGNGNWNGDLRCGTCRLEQSCGAITGYYCGTPLDECSRNSDCGGGFCLFKSDRWKCDSTIACPG